MNEDTIKIKFGVKDNDLSYMKIYHENYHTLSYQICPFFLHSVFADRFVSYSVKKSAENPDLFVGEFIFKSAYKNFPMEVAEVQDGIHED